LPSLVFLGIVLINFGEIFFPRRVLLDFLGAGGVRSQVACERNWTIVNQLPFLSRQKRSGSIHKDCKFWCSTMALVVNNWLCANRPPWLYRFITGRKVLSWFLQIGFFWRSKRNAVYVDNFFVFKCHNSIELFLEILTLI